MQHLALSVMSTQLSTQLTGVSASKPSRMHGKLVDKLQLQLLNCDAASARPLMFSMVLNAMWMVQVSLGHGSIIKWNIIDHSS